MGSRNFCRKILIRWDLAYYLWQEKSVIKTKSERCAFFGYKSVGLMLHVLFFESRKEIGVSERSCERVERTNHVWTPRFFVNIKRQKPMRGEKKKIRQKTCRQGYHVRH